MLQTNSGVAWSLLMRGENQYCSRTGGVMASCSSAMSPTISSSVLSWLPWVMQNRQPAHRQVVRHIEEHVWRDPFGRVPGGHLCAQLVVSSYELCSRPEPRGCALAERADHVGVSPKQSRESFAHVHAPALVRKLRLAYSLHRPRSEPWVFPRRKVRAEVAKVRADLKNRLSLWVNGKKMRHACALP